MVNERRSAMSDVDLNTPSIARMYDYFLGGAANFEVDRVAAEEFLKVFPGNTEWCRINRSFLGRAVRHLTEEAGIDQFLDLGSGVPTVGNVHEVAHQHNASARVAYVDIEPVAVHHAQRLLGNSPRVTVTQADVCEPNSVLNAPGVADLLDFSRPVAVLAVAIVDIVGAVDPTALISAYREACPPGSALALSHSARLTISDAEASGAEQVMCRTSTPRVRFRTRREVEELFPGYGLIEPGVVPTAGWRPDMAVSEQHVRDSNAYAGVGMLA